MTSAQHTLLALLLSCFFAAPLKARDKIHRIPPTSAGKSKIIEPDHLSLKAKAERQVMPQTEGVIKRTIANMNLKYKEGIDVSHYQGEIDWEEVARSSQISYVYIKATEGASLVDEYYQQNLEGARKVGLSVGSYHFYRPTIDWRVQFDNMTSTIQKESQDLVPIIDIEHASGSEEEFIDNLRQFIQKVTQHYGKKPLLYTCHNFYNRHFVGLFPDYHWMIARYRNDEPTLNDGKQYIIWQYTQNGRLGGIRGKVDRSQLMSNFSLRQLQM